MKRIETYLWIAKVINSCISQDQLNSCDNLINLYHMRHGDRFEASLLNGARSSQSCNVKDSYVSAMKSSQKRLLFAVNF